MKGAHAWRSLLFVHWEVPVAALRPLIPPSLAIDTHEGKAYVGLVPFTMPMVKPFVPFPTPLAFSFHETNVRTYVRPAAGGGAPGVWFFSLDAASSLAVRAARWLFHLPYFRADMQLEQDDGVHVHYRSQRRWPPPTPATCDVRCKPGIPLGPAAPGTLAHFLVERYFLYSLSPRGALYQAQVHHEPYPLRAAELVSLDETLVAAAGIRRPDQIDAPILYCDGVDVTVSGPSRSPA
jgi:uncharacterized protein